MTVPTEVFPPTTPFTSQTIDAPERMQSDAANDWLWPSPTDADEGVMVFGAAHVIVTLTLADSLAFAALATETVTGFCAGKLAGAAYSAVALPFAVIVPLAAMPFAMPFTLHVSWTELLPEPPIAAVKSCAPFSGTDADVGAIVMLSGADSKLTVAEALAVASAMLTAVTVTLDAGGVAGTV